MRLFFASPSLSEFRFVFLAAILFTGVVLPFHVLLAESMLPDGVSYLDVAETRDFLNSYWAPLLPSLLTLIPIRELYAPVQLLLGFVSLAFFGGAYLVVRELWLEGGWAPGTPLRGPQLALGSFFIALAAAAHAVLCGPQTLTPDALAGCFVLLAAGLFIRAEREGYPWRQGVVIGAILGLGYLAKYPVFVFGWLLVLLAAWRRLRFALAIGAGLAAISLPWVAALSFRYGRFTFGDAGWLNLAWFTGQLAKYGGRPEFQARAGVTYPPWLDPAAYQSPEHVTFAFAPLLDNVVWHLAWVTQSPVFAAMAVLGLILFCARRPTLDWRFLWPVGAMLSYLPVTLMCRYVAVWVVLALGLWGAKSLGPRGHALIAALLLIASLLGWRRIPAEREIALDSVNFARQNTHLRGESIPIGGNPFKASITLRRLRARVAPPSITIKGQWQTSDFSDSASWATPWRVISSKQGTR